LGEIISVKFSILVKVRLILRLNLVIPIHYSFVYQVLLKLTCNVQPASINTRT